MTHPQDALIGKRLVIENKDGRSKDCGTISSYIIMYTLDGKIGLRPTLHGDVRSGLISREDVDIMIKGQRTKHGLALQDQ